MVDANPCSPYLVRPLRTLRVACHDAARTHDETPPCGACAVKPECDAMTRRTHRSHKKSMLEARACLPAAQPRPGPGEEMSAAHGPPAPRSRGAGDETGAGENKI